MSSPSLERAARRSLLADAGYCAVSGAAFVGLGGRVGRALEVPRALVRSAGVATLVWSVALVWMAKATAWQPWVAVVATANAIAAALLVAAALTRRSRKVGAGLGLAACEVGGFALFQALVLRRDRARPAS